MERSTIRAEPTTRKAVAIKTELTAAEQTGTEQRGTAERRTGTGTEMGVTMT
jgi:hypothetical protein